MMHDVSSSARAPHIPARPAWPDDCERIEVAAVDHLAIEARDVSRSVEFYRRVFGFQVIERQSASVDGGVVIGVPGRAYLSVRARANAAGASSAPCIRWSFVVEHLDAVRESLWNLGVPTADGSAEPRRLHGWRNGRSLLIRDPDGHAIELVDRR